MSFYVLGFSTVFENQNVFYDIKKMIKMALTQFEFIRCPVAKQRICSRVGAVIYSPFIRASLFLAASSLCFLMMASLARSALPCSVFPSLWSFRMSSFDFCFSSSSLMERRGVQHKYHTHCFPSSTHGCGSKYPSVDLNALFR